MKNQRVAVIIPCYNAQKYLVQTLESVFRQSYSDYTIIAGNDGSSDGTGDILNRYSDRIKILNHPGNSNHGQAATYNLCLKEIRSEYVAFLDNDDLWSADKLKQQVDVLDRHPDIGLVYANGDVINDYGDVVHPFLAADHEESNDPVRLLLDCYIRTPSAVMVRYDILKKAGEFKIGIIPDHDMWLRIKEISNFFYIKEKLFSYRVHEGQLSQKATEKMWRDSFGTLERALQRHAYPSFVRRKRLAVIHYRLAEIGYKTRRYRLLPHILLSIYYDPHRAIKTVIRTFMK